LRVEILHRRVWLWDGQEPQARPALTHVPRVFRKTIG
jgi:hypothetical protein